MTGTSWQSSETSLHLAVTVTHDSGYVTSQYNDSVLLTTNAVKAYPSFHHTNIIISTFTCTIYTTLKCKQFVKYGLLSTNVKMLLLHDFKKCCKL